MKWIRTTLGAAAHAIASTGERTTLCGIHFDHVRAIVRPGLTDRCENCDREWRRKGRKCRPKRSRARREVYLERYTYRDWEET
jgi:hypothetical protein